METYKLMLLSMSFTLFTLYNLYIILSYGWRKSISDSYYADDQSNLFYFFLFFSGVPLMFVAQTFLMTLAVTFMVVVGAAPAFRREMEKTLHFIAAIGAIVFSILALYIEMGQVVVPSLIILFVAFSEIFKLKNKTYWQEMVAFYLSIVGIIIYLT